MSDIKIMMDGEEYTFPEGTSEDVMREALMSVHADSQPQAPQGGSIADPLGKGLSFGFADEAAGAIGATVNSAMNLFDAGTGDDWGEAYEGIRDAARYNEAAFAERNPKTAMGAEIGGALATGIGGAAKLGLGAAFNTVRGGAALGAAEGGLYGLGASEEETLGGMALDTAKGAGIGAVGGAAFPAAARGINRLRGGRLADDVIDAAEPPSTGQLFEEGGQAAERARAAGVGVRPQSLRAEVDRIATDAQENLIDHGLHPNSTRLLARIEEEVAGTIESSASMDFARLDNLRRLAGGAAKSGSPDDMRIATRIKNSLDDYIDNLDQSDVSTGNAREAAEGITEMRDKWARARRSETLDDAYQRAGDKAGFFTGSGFENALRSEFRKLLTSKRGLRGFSAEEIGAIRHAVRGGPMDNLLRSLGKLAPTGVVSFGVGSGAGAYIGGALGGPVGAAIGTAAVPAVGWLARRAATRRTEKNIAEAMRAPRRARLEE